MKKALVLTTALLLCAAMAQAEPSTIYENDFEGYEAGVSIIGLDGWSICYTAATENNNAIVEEGGYNGGKCLHIFAKDNLFGTHTDIDNVGGKSSQYDYKVSMMVKRPTQKADGSGEYTGDIIFGSNDGLGENHWIKKDLIEYIAKSLVDDPSAVSVNETEGEKGMVLQLKVADNDIGKVIGKYGRIAKAMRTVLSASAVKDGKRYSLDILDN